MPRTSYSGSSVNMKRAAAVQARRVKKAKVAKKTTTRPSTSASDVIEFVASQYSDMTATSDDGDGDDAGSFSQQLDYSLLHNALSACNKLHADVAKLTDTILQQQQKISDIEVTLVKILSLLQKPSQQLPPPPPPPAGSGPARVAAAAAATVAAAGSILTAAPSGSSCPPATGAGRGGRAAGGRKQQQRQLANTDVGDGDDEVGSDSYGHFTMIVHRTLRDVSRRKKNVVVSGLPEVKDTGKTDEDVFEEFCENFMPFKPPLAGPNACVRVGKSLDGKPRRLLVRLHSEEAAAAILEAAPLLRHCGNSHVAANVFVNADLSPSEAKLAFEARKKRREVRQRRAATATIHQAAMDHTPSTSRDAASGAPLSDQSDNSNDRVNQSSVGGDAPAALAAIASSSQVCGSAKPLDINATPWTGNIGATTALPAGPEAASAPVAAAATTSGGSLGSSTSFR